MKRACVAAAIAGTLAAVGTWQLAAAAWIPAKAVVAQRLIAASWEKARAEGTLPARPWPGADLRPIARLGVEHREVALYVLDNASPRALAFGPGHVSGTAAPGSGGNAVIVAHRDTHFAFLRAIRTDEVLTVETARGERARYRVRSIEVVDRHATRLLDPADSAQLTLITCWPFDAVMPGTPWRYVVIADRLG